jgi:hypothetical protein
MNTLVCTGLDGANPLHMLASLGILHGGHEPGFVSAMSWQFDAQWRPVFSVNDDSGALWDALCDCISPRRLWQARHRLDGALAALQEAGDAAASAKSAVEANRTAGDRTALRNAKDRMAQAQAQTRRMRTRCRRLENAFSAVGRARTATIHPIVAKADHLDDITKGGLSREGFRAVAGLPAQTGIVGLAADLEVQDKKKTTIGRTAFSFANNNSKKMLLADFAKAAVFCTPERLRDGVLGPGQMLDGATGLGWDPGSQRSYALQFWDPQDDTRSQVAVNCLAFIGLACLPVVPGEGRPATTGFGTFIGAAGPSHADQDADSDDGSPAKGRRHDAWTWPIWDRPLPIDVVLSLCNLPELATQEPRRAWLARLGVVEVFRSRRISVNKRSFFSPSRPV